MLAGGPDLGELAESLDREGPGAGPAVAVGYEGVEPVHGAEGEAEGVVLEGGRLPQGRSAQIYTVRQCVTSTFFFFFKASFSENYFMVLKIYDNPHTLVYGVTSQVCISSNNNTSNSGGVTH